MKTLVIIISVAVIASLECFCPNLMAKEQKIESPLISIVYLLKTPRSISEEIIRESASKAFGATFDADDKDATEFVVELPPPPVKGIQKDKAACFMIKVNGVMYMVNNFSVPYMDNPEKFAQNIADGRLRGAIERHSAWISVDAMGDIKDMGRKAKAYSDIAKMIAQLAGPDCLAIYCPELERCNEYDETLLETLNSSDPLSLFEEPTFAPIINVDGEDSRMVKAVIEARKRWPEFVAAFKNNAFKDNPFIVKAEFKDGHMSEFMWISATRIDDEIITGILENKPNELTNVKKGQEVVVPVSSLNDWLYSQDEEAIGGFTIKVIQEIQQEK